MVAGLQDSPPRGAVEVLWSSDADHCDTVRLAVTIPTYRRPDQVVDTLNSVLSQSAPLPFAVIVMDNDAKQEGANAARVLLERSKLPAVVLAANRRGNCAAYNAGWWTALQRYPELEWVLVIDDDEIARPGWIDEMVRVARTCEADCTGAPQWPVFAPGAAVRAADHPVFRPPYTETSTVPVLYSSGNVLIAADLLRRHGYPYLDERFNFLGGGDADFYARMRSKGATFAWAHRAGQDETIPARRSEFSWLNARALRNGSISAAIEAKAAETASDHAKRWGKSLALLGLSAPRGLALALRDRIPSHALVPMLVAWGRILMEFGFANEQYRAADRN